MVFLMQRKPNIILVYTDQQRYDTLGVNGNEHIMTPNLDNLANNGVLFSRAFVTTPICTPSRVALFTGRYNHTNLSYNNSRQLFDRETHFVDLLNNNGYQTAMVGKDHCFKYKLRNDAFDYIKLAGHTSIGSHSNEKEKYKKIKNSRKGKMYVPYSEDPVKADENITASIFNWGKEYIKDVEDDKDPFFLWTSIPDPHPPYMVSEPYASMYDDIDIPLPAWREGEKENKPYRQQLIEEWDKYHDHYPEQEDILKLKRIYWGMVSCIDYYFGKFYDFLKKEGLLENTIIVFTSDHGDYMGDHHMIRKGPHLYEALTHVPLIFYYEDEFVTGETDAMVSNIDIFPTIFDIIGLECPSQVQGKSFSNVLLGETNKHREKVFMEHGDPGKPLQPEDLSPDKSKKLKQKHHHLSNIICRGKTKCVRTERWKYCYTPGDVDELYDLKEDPNELVNLADKKEYQDIIAEYREDILKWLIRTEDTLNR